MAVGGQQVPQGLGLRRSVGTQSACIAKPVDRPLLPLAPTLPLLLPAAGVLVDPLQRPRPHLDGQAEALHDGVHEGGGPRSAALVASQPQEASQAGGAEAGGGGERDLQREWDQWAMECSTGTKPWPRRAKGDVEGRAMAGPWGISRGRS